jgi:hypothetical protein
MHVSSRILVHPSGHAAADWDNRFRINFSSPTQLSEEPQNDGIVVTAQRRRSSILRRIYRWFVPDPCSWRGTNEGFGVPAGYSPYDVAKGRSLISLYKHVLPEHEWSSRFSESRFLIGVVLTTIQTPPTRGSRGTLVYTVNTGQNVGYDSRHGANSDYITVVMGPLTSGERALVTAYPGCR